MPQKQKTNFPSLPKEVRADRRRLAFRKLDDGWDKYEVAELAEVHFKTVEDWQRNRKEIVANGYHGQKRGNPNDRRILDDVKQKRILSVIQDSLPDEHDICAYLWSRKAIAEFVKKEYAISMIPQCVSRYAQLWGLSPQRPKKQASEQDAKKIETWLEKDYPKIVRRAKKEKAEIHWGDETGLNINTNYQKTYAPKGKTPVVKIPAKKTNYSMISSLTNQGKLRYMAYKGGMNAALFKIFLERLVKDTDRKIFLIVDNLKAHHAKIIQTWQENHKKEIEIFFPAPIFSARKSR
ncbi:MAG TPA: IS630 family transposase [Candidatus Moranbacteria bacterium]|nr:IS630 family transposase [Candidatus Moranbacteria bacterium]